MDERDRRRIVRNSWMIILGVACMVFSGVMFFRAFTDPRAVPLFWGSAIVGAMLILGAIIHGNVPKRRG